jgi:mannosyltransferase OCH1-like enzyme
MTADEWLDDFFCVNMPEVFKKNYAESNITKALYSIYDNNFDVSPILNEEEKIPKIIHQFWLGKKKPNKLLHSY